jgi:multiple sugar transport system ATP-binding protein
MASLEFDEVRKTYDGDVWAVRDLTLTVNHGEFLVLVGPSGCGKTTALRMLAGLEQITSGEIRIGGVRINEVSPRERDIAMVFQNYALYPHMSVYDNIGYGLKVRRMPRAERHVRIEEAASMLGLTAELKRKPSQLSGGQRQRVAMGRAIVRRPEVFLMDEPLSNLDARLRVQMRTEIARLQRELGVTTMYVTHDQVEAMTMADRVAVLRGGELQQLDTPQQVYFRPANLFVAVFIGSPAMNVLEGELTRDDGRINCRIGTYPVPIPDEIIASEPDLAQAIGRTVAVGIRPEAISVTPGDGPGLHGKVVVSEELGSEVISHIEVEATSIRDEAIVEGLTNDAPNGMSAETGRTQAGTTVIVARLPPEADFRRGTPLSLEFDPHKLHFFDLDTGNALRTRFTRALTSAPPATLG